MKKAVFLSMFFLLALAISPAWAHENQNPSATATVATNQTQTANMISAPTLAPSASASSNQTTSVGVQSNPVASAGGGTGIGIGGAGGSVLAVGGDQYMVLDQRNFSKVYNRQFYQARIDQSPNTMQYYGQFEKNPWNVTPIMGATWRVNPKLEMKIPYYRLTSHIYRKLDPVSRVTVTGYGTATGILVGKVSVVVTEEQDTDDTLAIVRSIAAKNGANIIEIVASDATVVPTSEGWHVGTGVGASGIIGNDEKASVSGAGGTGYGKSSITRETRPFVSARLWAGRVVKLATPAGFQKNGATAPKISIKKIEVE